jgi:hypothetical protein
MERALRELEAREREASEAREVEALCCEACGLELRRVKPGPQCDGDGRPTLTLTESIAAPRDGHARRVIPMGLFDAGSVRRRSVDYKHVPIPSPGGA